MRRASSGASPSSSVPAQVDLVHDVVEPLLPDREVAGADHGAQGLRGEHGLRLITLCPGPSTATVSANSAVLLQWPSPSSTPRTPLAPLRERLHAKLAEVLDAGRYILGPEVAAFEAEFAAYLGAAPRDRRRQRHRRARRSRCARWASARATRSSCPRSRSTRRPRRSRRPARGRCSATSTRRRSASRRRPCAPR